MSARAWGGMGLALLLGVAGCSSKQATTAPAPPSPPEISAVFPEPWSTRVDYKTPIWARFTEPLDPATVNDKTVFLKIDTRRIPIHLTLEDSARRIVIHPLNELELRRTHTVEITTSVHTAQGAALSSKYFWQFTVISLRRLESPEPVDAKPLESTLTPLFWRPNDASAGPVSYQVYAGTDSAAVVAGVSLMWTVTSNNLLTGTRWEPGADTFWRVVAHNVETGETETGPLWRFHTYPSDTPIDSLTLTTQDCGYWDIRALVWRCQVLLSGGQTIGVVRYNVEGVDSTLCLADARIVLPYSTFTTSSISATINSIQPGYTPCSPQFLGPPSASFLSSGVSDAEFVMRFSAPLLGQQIQARIRRHPEFNGYGLTSDRTVTYVPFNTIAGVQIYYYRPGAAFRTQTRSPR